MRPLRLIALAFLLIVPSSPAPAAPPTLTLTWDDCGALVVSKDFAGPGFYAQTISAEGLTQPLNSYFLGIGMGPVVVDAWQFYSPGLRGCQGSSRLAVSAAATGCSAVPGAVFTTVSMGPGITDPYVYLNVAATVSPAFVPDPAVRYALVHFVYDHTHSVAGPSGTGTCGGAAVLQCFGISGAGLNSGFTPGVDYVWANDMITWQQPDHSGVCPYAVPIRRATWGLIKTLYR